MFFNFGSESDSRSSSCLVWVLYTQMIEMTSMLRFCLLMGAFQHLKYGKWHFITEVRTITYDLVCFGGKCPNKAEFKTNVCKYYIQFIHITQSILLTKIKVLHGLFIPIFHSPLLERWRIYVCRNGRTKPSSP